MAQEISIRQEQFRGIGLSEKSVGSVQKGPVLLRRIEHNGQSYGWVNATVKDGKLTVETNEEKFTLEGSEIRRSHAVLYDGRGPLRRTFSLRGNQVLSA